MSEIVEIEILSVRVPAGNYWVGDPCYAVPDELWMPWLRAANYEANPRILIGGIEGHTVIGVHTAYGDGVFYDRQGRQYGVDAGLIGVVPEALARGDVAGSHLIAFNHPVDIEYEEDGGVIHIGSISIETDPDDGKY